MYALEGPVTTLNDFEGVWGDPKRRESLLATFRLLERDVNLLGASPHLIVPAVVADDLGQPEQLYLRSK